MMTCNIASRPFRTQVSLLSFGSWVTFANADQIETGKQAAECLHAAKEPA